MKPFSIKALHPSGYSVTFHIEPEDGKLHTIIAKLNRFGFRPDVAGDTWMRTPEGDPICPKHGVPMHKREKQGDTWYSHATIDKTTGEKHYCRGYSTKNGSGYDLPSTPRPKLEQPPQLEGATPNGNNSKLTPVPPPPEPTQPPPQPQPTTPPKYTFTQANQDLYA